MDKLREPIFDHDGDTPGGRAWWKLYGHSYGHSFDPGVAKHVEIVLAGKSITRVDHQGARDRGLTFP